MHFCDQNVLFVSEKKISYSGILKNNLNAFLINYRNIILILKQSVIFIQKY